MPNPHRPKALTHSLHAHIFKIQRIQHERTHTVIYQGKGTEEKAFKKKKKQATTKEVL